MSFRVVPLGRAWMCLVVPGQDRRGWGPELVVLGSGARDSPRLAEVSAPSRPGRPVCQSLGAEAATIAGPDPGGERIVGQTNGEVLAQPLNSTDSAPDSRNCNPALPWTPLYPAKGSLPGDLPAP